MMTTLRHNASRALLGCMRTMLWSASHATMANILSGSRTVALLVLLASFVSPFCLCADHDKLLQMACGGHSLAAYWRGGLLDITGNSGGNRLWLKEQGVHVSGNVDAFDLHSYLSTAGARAEDVVLCIFNCARGRNRRAASDERLFRSPASGRVPLNERDWKTRPTRLYAGLRLYRVPRPPRPGILYS